MTASHLLISHDLKSVVLVLEDGSTVDLTDMLMNVSVGALPGESLIAELAVWANRVLWAQR